MTRLIDADALNMYERLKSYYGDAWRDAQEEIDNAPTVDAVPLDGSFLKMSKGDYLIYNRHWLYEHFDQEVEIQRSVMKSMGYEPAIKDAEPVKRGMWTFIRLTDKDWGHKAKECSSCGSTFFNTTLWDFCPNCGADMRGEKDG